MFETERQLEYKNTDYSDAETTVAYKGVGETR